MRSEHKPATKWEKIFIFISSTFNDMHAERDFVVKKVFPQLAEWCERRKLRMVDIDLRWGVTEEDATRNRSVVEVCLNRIDECRPFFLCFLGQRYGWVPRKENISDETLERFPGLGEAVDGQHSVTELEILHALVRPFHPQNLLEEKKYYSTKYAFFYLRDDSYLKDLPSEPAYLRRIYTDEAEGDLSKRDFLLQKNKKLRDVTVPETKRPIFTYQANWSNKERSPELALPLKCPAVLNENVDRWRWQWQEAADVRVTGLDVAEDLQEEKKAKEFNEKIIQGRLIDFKAKGMSLDEVMLHSLKEAILDRFPDRLEIEGADELQTELDQQEQFLFINSGGFIEREGDFEELDSYLRSDSNKPFVLTAPGGTGKTTLLANWIDRYHSRNEGRTGESIHFRFIGQSDLSTTVANLLHYLLRELQVVARKIPASTTETRRTSDGGEETVEVTLEIPQDPIKLHEAWPNLLEAAGRRGKTILVLDALNQLESGLSDTRWLPSKLPENVKLVVSFKLGDEAAEELLERFRECGNAHLSEVKPFDDFEDRRRLVRAYLSQYLKELDEQHLEELIGSPGAENPLYLKIVLSELRVFGAFANLGEKVSKEFGDTPISAFHGVLSRLERDPAYSPLETEQSVPLLFGLLAHARHGLSADELSSLFIQALNLKDNSESREAAVNTIYLFLRQVRPFLARRDGRYDFFFESFDIAARERYVAQLSDASGAKRFAKEWHRVLANYFYHLPTWREIAISEEVQRSIPSREPTRRKIAELPYHLTEAEDWDRLEDTLCDLNFIEAKCAVGKAYDLNADYHLALAALSESQDEVQTETKRNQRLERHVRELLAYAKGETEHLDIIPSIEPWSQEQVKQHAHRVISNPTQFDRLTLFAHFVRSRSHALVKFAQLPGFVIQEGMNYAAEGPIRSQTESLMERPTGGILLLQSRESRADYNPHPALVRELRGHKNVVSSVAIAASGVIAVSGGKDMTIRVWDLRTGENLWALEGHDSPVTCVAVNAEGTRAVSGGKQGDLLVWDLSRGNCLRILAPAISPAVRTTGHSLEVEAVSITPCGKTAVSAGTDEVVRVWDIEHGRNMTVLEGHNSIVCGVGVTANGEMAVSLGSNIISTKVGESDPWEEHKRGGMDTLRIWEIRGEKNCRAALEGPPHVATFLSLAVTPDGTIAVSGIDSKEAVLQVWDLVSGESRCIGQGGNWKCNGVGLTADGKIAVSADDDGKVRLWHVEKGECFRVLEGHAGRVNSVAISADGRTALSGGLDSKILIWDVEKGYSKKKPKAHSRSATVIVASQSGSHFISGGGDGTLALWSADDQGAARTLGRHKRAIRRICVSSEGQLALSSDGDWLGNSDRISRVWNLQQIKLEYELRVGDVIEALGLTPDRNRAVSGDWGGFVRIWSLETGESLHAFQSSGKVDCMCILPDGREVISMHGHRVSRWDTETGECLATAWAAGNRWEPDLGEHVTVAPESPHAACLTADGTHMLLSSGSDIFLLNPSTGRAILFLGHEGNITSIAITPDGRRGISGSLDGTLRVWDLSTRQCTAVLEHGQKVRALSVSADGSLVLSAGEDAIVKLWDLNHVECVAAFHAGDEITCLSQLTTSGTFACGTRSGEIIVIRCKFCPDTAPLVTAVRMWIHSNAGTHGHWTESYLALCPHCGERIAVTQDVLDAIAAIKSNAGVSRLDAPCLTLHVQAWHNPQLCSSCTLCGSALRFNPFFVDNRPEVPWWKFWNRWRQATGS